MYVALTLLNWDLDFFLKSTPKLWLKSFILHLETNNPDVFKKGKDTMSISESPYW
ncbi:hypothetical protein CAT7_07433 [Carnobacterium sp. AT7]|nr:hypothetical protein CAT7_07433 [Carnobacterium sp. AT7]